MSSYVITLRRDIRVGVGRFLTAVVGLANAQNEEITTRDELGPKSNGIVSFQPLSTPLG